MVVSPGSVLTSVWEKISPIFWPIHGRMQPSIAARQVRVLAAVLSGLRRACHARGNRDALLTWVQASHLLDLMTRLIEFGTPNAVDLDISDLRCRPGFQPLYVLKDTLGPLNTTTAQIVFGLIPRSNTTVVLGVFLGSGELRPMDIALIEDRYHNYVSFQDLVEG